MNKTSALMMTREYKQLASDSHELNYAYGKVDRAANDLARRINSPIEPEDKGSVMRAVMICRNEIESMQKILVNMAETCAVVGDNSSRTASGKMAGELMKIAKELVAESC